MTSAATRRIAVLGHFHGRNLGDDLVVRTILAAVRRRVPEAELLAVSLSPADTRRRHGVEAFPINPAPASGGTPGPAQGTSERRAAVVAALRRVPLLRRVRLAVASAAKVAREVPFLFRARRLLRDVDTVVVAGSGQLLDQWHGAWGHPYAIFRWAVLARLGRTRLLVPSIGAGPIDGALGAFMIRRSVAAASYISVRDAYSGDLLHSIGVVRDLPVRPDMGYGLPLGELDPAPPDDGADVTVGVNAMAHEDPRYWPRGDVRRFDAYLAKMAGVVARLLEDGHRVVLFSSQTSTDALVASDLVAALAERGLAGHPALRNAFPEIDDVDGLVEVIRGCDYVLGARYHSLLLPLAAGIPTLGLAYHPKTQALFERAGRPDWCLDIDAFTVDELVDAFARLREADGAEVRRSLVESGAAACAAVESQFDELLGAPSVVAAA